MSIALKRILPTLFEVISLLIFSVVILILGNSRALLQYAGLDPSTQVLKNGTNTVISSGLTRLDNFSFTDRIVTFAIWAVVGIFCFSIVQAVGQAYHEFKQDEDLSSSRYIHPSTFTKSKFWKSVLLGFAVLVTSFAVLAIVVYGFFVVILPTGLSYGHAFLFKTSFSNIGGFLFAIAIVWVWLLLLDLCIRLVANRHRLTDQ